MISSRTCHLVALLALAAISIGCGTGRSTTPSPDTSSPPPRTDSAPPTELTEVVGTLRTGVRAVGGETTGIQLLLETPLRGRRVVDVAGLDEATAQRLKSRRVRITGALRSRSYPERGEVVELAVHDIEALPDGPFVLGQKVTIEGYLQVGLMAPGGETTGYRLAYRINGVPGVQVIEVALPEELVTLVGEGGPFRVTGQIVEHLYVERGRVLRLQAESVARREPGGLELWPGQTVDLRGRLLKGLRAAGGETMGIALSVATGPSSSRTIELDTRDVPALGELAEGTSIRVRGRIDERSWPHRGPVLVLRATSFEEAADETS